MPNMRSRACLVLVGVLLAPLAGIAAEAQMAWTAVAPMSTGREIFSMTELQDGRVLVVGGQGYNSVLRSCEIFDPASGTWSDTGQMSSPRATHATVRLLDGRVLAVGGYDAQGVVATAEIFDPATEAWTLAPQPARASYNPVALLLNDGRVFLLHSWGSQAEIFDPIAETWSNTSSMGDRNSTSATLLADGRVLVAGGYAGGAGATTALVYNPNDDTWTTTGPMTPRRGHAATLLANGRVLVVGGLITGGNTYLASAELYDPATNTWSATGSMATSRTHHTATLLTDGTVLVAGGLSSINLNSSERYDPATGLFSPGPALGEARYYHRAALLPGGTPLVVGGWGNNTLPSAEVYAAAIATDTAPPTVTLTAPANGASLSGTVTLTADAADADSGVVSVTFYAYGRLLGADATEPYELDWDTAQWPRGTTTVRAQARDRSNKTAESSVTVTVLDVTPPVVTLTSPAPGELVGDSLLLEATATDASSWLSVEFLVDGVVVASDTIGDPGFAAAISASRLEPGPHTASARAWDDYGFSGNSATSAPVSFTVSSPGEQATFDTALHVPACSGGSSCDSGLLLVGRGPIGPEPNAPNTLAPLCPDGWDGMLQAIDRLRIATTDGSPLAAGKEVRVSATVRPWGVYSALDLYYAPDASNPQWQLVQTLPALGPDEQVLTWNFPLAQGGVRQAIRGVFRAGGFPQPEACSGSPIDDNDDLVFGFGPALPPATGYDPDTKTPRCAGFGTNCDTGTLLIGRGSSGPEPNAPNTTIGECSGESGWGQLHDQPSIDRIQVRSADAGVLARNKQLRVDVTVFASTNYSNERLDVFDVGYDANPYSPFWPYWGPTWRLVGSAVPSAPGLQVLSVWYTPGDALLSRAVRAAYRYSGDPDYLACSYQYDHDDLWFRLDSGLGGHALGIDRQGSGEGTVDISFEGGGSFMSCPLGPASPFCDVEMPGASPVVLTAVPTHGSFGGWSGACSGTDACHLSLTEARQVRARFDPAPTAILTVVLDGENAAQGFVDSMVFTGPMGTDVHCAYPGGEAGPVTCQGSYDLGSVVRIYAGPGANSVFAGWGGACAGAGASPECEITITEALTVNAHFDGPRLLTVVLDGLNGAEGFADSIVFTGSMGTDVHCAYPGGAAGPVTCQGMYQLGTVVKIFAGPGAQSVFAGWGGACAGAGTSPECEITITDALTVNAQFDGPRLLTVVLEGANGAEGFADSIVFTGSMGTDVHCAYPGGAAGPVTCQGSYRLGTVVRIFAGPGAQSVFARWGGACAGAGAAPECEVTITDALTVNAQFDGPRLLTVVLDGANGAQGFADSIVFTGSMGTDVHCAYPGGAAGPVTCQGSYRLGTVVKIFAGAGAQSVFARWGGACAGAGAAPECEVTITDALTVNAQFDGPRLLTVVLDGLNGAQGFADSAVFTGSAGTDVHCAYPGGVAPPVTCQGSYQLGTVVRISAGTGGNSLFAGWGGACAAFGSTPLCELTINDFKTVSARFEPLPTLSIGDVTVTEGNASTTAVFAVTLSAASASTVSVGYATADGTATAGSDYVTQSGTLTFTAGQTSKTISVVVNGDTVVEPNETFVVNLLSPTGAAIADGQGQATIANDDSTPPPAGSEPVVWTSAVGVGVSGNSLTKTAPAGWGNGGAVSTQQIASGDGGYVEFTASETTTYRMLGLSNGDTNASYNDIDFALYEYAGQIQVYEAGSFRGTFGTYSPGDTLRVAVTGGVVKYSRNGNVFYSSARTPVYPLLVDAALYSASATLSSAFIGAPAAPPPPPPPGTVAVVWTATVGVSVSGNSLTKNTVNGWGNAGAVSTQLIADGEGYVEFTASETTTYRMLGLSNGDANASYNDIDFALYEYAGQVQVYEAGSLKGTFGTYSHGDTLRIAVAGGAVKYSRNGNVFYSSTKTPIYPLLVDTALYSANATLNSVVIGISAAPPPPAGTVAVVWTAAVGVSVGGNSLTKNAVNGWGNAGAVSTQEIASGDGYVEFTASETTTYRMLGLSNGNTNASYNDIDFALYEYAGQIQVYEVGSFKGAFGTYSPGDTLRVAVGGGIVRYSRNGAVFYSSTKTPTYPLLVDTALYSQGATISNAGIAGAQ